MVASSKLEQLALCILVFRKKGGEHRRQRKTGLRDRELKDTNEQVLFCNKAEGDGLQKKEDEHTTKGKKQTWFLVPFFP